MTLKIGVVGFSSGDFDAKKASKALNKALLKMTEKHQDVEIVSGYTNLGIPALAYAWAFDNGFLTTGIACSKAYDYDIYPCDIVTIVGAEWGDESSTFLEYIDCLVRIGGGKQSFRELAEFKKLKPDAKIIEVDL